MTILRNIFIVILITLSTSGFAQVKVDFTILGDIPFDGLPVSFIKAIDLNNDGYDDLFAIYRNEQSVMEANVYLNDKKGNFNQKVSNQFIGLANTLVDFGDVDNDGDIDVIIAGNLFTNFNLSYTYLYLNNGYGKFVQSTTNTFTGFKYGSVKLFDADNDSDLDIIICGIDDGLGTSCELYQNNGNGIYQLKNDTTIVGMKNGEIGVSDIDNDGDNDLVISGATQSTTPSKAFTYINDGSANFTKRVSNIDNLTGGTISFLDVDNDGDLDLSITGNNTSSSISHDNQLYLNDSLGNFTKDTINNFFGNSNGSAKIVDIDKDGDIDILFSGSIANGTRTGLYINNGNGNFTIHPAFGYLKGLISDVSDIDNDGHTDIFVYGPSNETSIYLNDSLTNFTPKKGESIKGVQNSSVAFEKVNNDSMVDVLVTGSTSNLPLPTTRLYFGDTNLTFQESINTILDTVYKSSIAFDDVDGDTDKDLFISGETINNSYISKLYLNDGNANFTLSSNNSFIGVKGSSVIFFDVDMDNDNDLLIQGIDSSNNPISKLYLNNGAGVFSLSSNNLKGVRPSKSIFVDLDNDNDYDLIISGNVNGQPEKTFVYINNGSGSYSRDSLNYLNIARSMVIDHLDVDNDGDEDILVQTPFGYNNFFRNNGQGILTGDNIFNSAFYPMTPNSNNHPSTADGKFFDVDNDGDKDLLSLGGNRYGRATTNLYLNDSGKFTFVENLPFHGSSNGDFSIADIDSDGDKDLLISGANHLNTSLSKIYINRTCSIKYDTLNAVFCDKFYSPTGKVWTQSGTYIDTINSSDRCDSIITYNLSIYHTDTSIIDSGSFLFSSSNDKLQWLDCSNSFQKIMGDTNQRFYPQNNGSYAVEVINNSCIDTSACYSVIVTNIVESSLKQIIVYPNPAKSNIKVIAPYNLNLLEYELYTFNGRLVSKGRLSKANNSLTVRDFANGVYILKLMNQYNVDYIKIIKN